MRVHTVKYLLMRKALHTTKITLEALRLLSMVSAITGEKRYEVQERLFRQELGRLAPEMLARYEALPCLDETREK
jgi:hypothetical protein